jgi:negative regulator of flagellin synthesis FlgM
MIEKINEVGSVSAVAGVKTRRGTGYGADGDVAGDGVAVSEFAREMANISQEMSRVPDVREDRVNELKRQIEEGSYNPDLRKLAGRLVWAGINKIED